MQFRATSEPREGIRAGTGESGGHFKLELGGQYHWNLQLTLYFSQILPIQLNRLISYETYLSCKYTFLQLNY